MYNHIYRDIFMIMKPPTLPDSRYKAGPAATIANPPAVPRKRLKRAQRKGAFAFRDGRAVLVGVAANRRATIAAAALGESGLAALERRSSNKGHKGNGDDGGELHSCWSFGW